MLNVDSSKRGNVPPSSVTGDRQYLVVFVGDQRYATPLEQVREVVDVKTSLPVPNALPYVDGMVDLRGQILSVLDLAKLISDKPAAQTCRATLVVQSGEGLIGLNVEDLYGVVSFSEAQIMPEASRTEGRFNTVGVARLDDELVTILDLTDLVACTPVLHA